MFRILYFFIGSTLITNARQLETTVSPASHLSKTNGQITDFAIENRQGSSNKNTNQRLSYAVDNLFINNFNVQQNSHGINSQVKEGLRSNPEKNLKTTNGLNENIKDLYPLGYLKYTEHNAAQGILSDSNVVSIDGAWGSYPQPASDVDPNYSKGTAERTPVASYEYNKDVQLEYSNQGKISNTMYEQNLQTQPIPPKTTYSPYGVIATQNTKHVQDNYSAGRPVDDQAEQTGHKSEVSYHTNLPTSYQSFKLTTDTHKGYETKLVHEEGTPKNNFQPSKFLIENLKSIKHVHEYTGPSTFYNQLDNQETQKGIHKPDIGTSTVVPITIPQNHHNTKLPIVHQTEDLINLSNYQNGYDNKGTVPTIQHSNHQSISTFNHEDLNAPTTHISTNYQDSTQTISPIAQQVFDHIANKIPSHENGYDNQKIIPTSGFHDAFNHNGVQDTWTYQNNYKYHEEDKLVPANHQSTNAHQNSFEKETLDNSNHQSANGYHVNSNPISYEGLKPDGQHNGAPISFDVLKPEGQNIETPVSFDVFKSDNGPSISAGALQPDGQNNVPISFKGLNGDGHNNGASISFERLKPGDQNNGANYKNLVEPFNFGTTYSFKDSIKPISYGILNNEGQDNGPIKYQNNYREQNILPNLHETDQYYKSINNQNGNINMVEQTPDPINKPQFDLNYQNGWDNQHAKEHQLSQNYQSSYTSSKPKPLASISQNTIKPEAQPDFSHHQQGWEHQHNSLPTFEQINLNYHNSNSKPESPISHELLSNEGQYHSKYPDSNQQHAKTPIPSSYLTFKSTTKQHSAHLHNGNSFKETALPNVRHHTLKDNAISSLGHHSIKDNASPHFGQHVFNHNVVPNFGHYSSKNNALPTFGHQISTTLSNGNHNSNLKMSPKKPTQSEVDDLYQLPIHGTFSDNPQSIPYSYNINNDLDTTKQFPSTQFINGAPIQSALLNSEVKDKIKQFPTSHVNSEFFKDKPVYSALTANQGLFGGSHEVAHPTTYYFENSPITMNSTTQDHIKYLEAVKAIIGSAEDGKPKSHTKLPHRPSTHGHNNVHSHKNTGPQKVENQQHSLSPGNIFPTKGQSNRSNLRTHKPHNIQYIPSLDHPFGNYHEASQSIKSVDHTFGSNHKTSQAMRHKNKGNNGGSHKQQNLLHSISPGKNHENIFKTNNHESHIYQNFQHTLPFDRKVIKAENTHQILALGNNHENGHSFKSHAVRSLDNQFNNLNLKTLRSDTLKNHRYGHKPHGSNASDILKIHVHKTNINRSSDTPRGKVNFNIESSNTKSYKKPSSDVKANKMEPTTTFNNNYDTHPSNTYHKDNLKSTFSSGFHSTPIASTGQHSARLNFDHENVLKQFNSNLYQFGHEDVMGYNKNEAQEMSQGTLEHQHDFSKPQLPSTQGKPNSLDSKKYTNVHIPTTSSKIN